MTPPPGAAPTLHGPPWRAPGTFPSGLHGPPARHPAPAPGSAPPSRGWFARLLGHLGTLVAVVAVGTTGMVFGAFHGLGHEGSPGHAVWSSIAVLLAFLTGVSMIWRRRVPVTILLVNAGAALVLPLDPLGTLIALTWVIGTSPVRHRVWSTSLAALVTGVALARDAWREPPGVVFATTPPDGGERLVMTWWGYLVVGVVLLGVAIGVGIIRRLRATADRARASAQVQARSAAVLRGELDRQEERDVIAREMHDTVAHHLSLVSLHAAVLEVTTTDPAVPESARAVRESAHRALEEMRGLISSLRDSGSAGYTGHQPTLADLPRLISDARSAGVAIAEDVVLIGGDPPPALTRAVYRIVQEALTNALKHAPGAGVRLAVRATSGYGVEIVVANWTAPARALRQPGPGGALARHGSGAGVIGMRERARALGGELWAGQDGHVWVVRAQLPWRVG